MDSIPHKYFKDSMKAMKPLECNYRALIWLCVNPNEKNVSRWLKAIRITFALSVFVANSCAVIASIAFFSTFVSIDLEESLYSLLQIAAYIFVVYASIATFVTRRKFHKIFKDLSEIYEKCKKFSNSA